MKPSILITTALLLAGGIAPAQERFELPQGEPVLVYSLPRIGLCIEVDVEKTTETPGEFYQYSGRYLAEQEVITAGRDTYRVTGVRVKPRAEADPARTYAVAGSKECPLPAVSVDGRGLLRGINVPPEKAHHAVPAARIMPAKPAPQVKPLPLTEEYMLASSTAKMAEGAAKQIYRIRESRLALLTADVDQLPADGESLRAMLDGMDSMERELTELFTGTTVRETTTHTLHLLPVAAMQNEVLFRLSPLKGLVPADDLSGAPYYINVAPATIDTYVPDPSGKKAARPDLYTVLPAPTRVTIGDGREECFAGQFLLPQFGQLVPVPAELLRQGARIAVDVETGRMLDASPAGRE